MKNETIVTNLITTVVLLIFGFLGIELLSFANKSDFWTDYPGIQLTVRQLGSLFIVSVVLSFIWQLLGKRAFRKELLTTIKISDELHSSGIKQVSFSIKGINWDELWQKTQYIDLFFTYARTWRGYNDDEIKNMSKISNAIIRIVLPDPEDKNMMDRLAKRFDKSTEKQIADINQAIEYFSILYYAKETKAKIELWLSNVDPVFSMYRFDDYVVLAMYPHKEKVKVPHFIAMKPGSIFNFAMEQFELLASDKNGISRNIFTQKSAATSQPNP